MDQKITEVSDGAVLTYGSITAAGVWQVVTEVNWISVLLAITLLIRALYDGLRFYRYARAKRDIEHDG